MDMAQFVHNSIGCWKSQRSAHHLAFAHFEAVQSEIQISLLQVTDPPVQDLCRQYHIDPIRAIAPFSMSWQGQSDWEDSEPSQGSCVLVPIPDPDGAGQLLRSQGYAEEIPAIGRYVFLPDGTFVLTTPYDRASAEERIWFVTPQMRCRVSLIKTRSGTGVVTASFASEIRV
jgi:phycoerythrin-associated linker protein